jgi:hypothetical protein
VAPSTASLLLAALAALASPGAAVAAGAAGRVDLTDPAQRLETYIRAVGDTSGKPVAEYATATIFAYVPGEKPRPLFRFEVLGVGRYEKIDGGYLRLSREMGFYLDLKSGEPLRRWFNPWLQREVEVVPVQNDPVNRRFTLQGSTFNYTEAGDDVIFHREVPLRYPNPLDRAGYPLYSSGAAYEAMEMFQNFISRRDIDNRKLTSLPARGSWTRFGPWLPWMEMGLHPGVLVYHSRSIKPANGLDGVPQDLRERIARADPKFLQAPERFVEPDQTSWTVFKEIIDARRRASGQPAGRPAPAGRAP